jgi:hypothetical protein
VVERESVENLDFRSNTNAASVYEIAINQGRTKETPLGGRVSAAIIAPETIAPFTATS